MTPTVFFFAINKAAGNNSVSTVMEFGISTTWWYLEIWTEVTVYNLKVKKPFNQDGILIKEKYMQFISGAVNMPW